MNHVVVACLVLAVLGMASCGPEGESRSEAPTKADEQAQSESSQECSTWIEALRDFDDAKNYVSAANALRDSAHECSAELAAVLRSGESPLAGRVAAVLNSVDRLPPETVQPLIAGLAVSKDHTYIEYASSALQKQDDAILASTGSAVISCIRNGQMAVSLLSLIERLGHELDPQLVQLLDHDAELPRLGAVMALQASKAHSTEAVAALEGRLGDESLFVRAEAAVALALLGVDVERQLGHLSKWLGQASADTKYAVLRRIKKLGPKAASLRDEVQLVHDQAKDTVLREEARQALDSLGDTPR